MVEKRKDRVEFLKPAGKIEMGLVDLSETGIAIMHPNAVTAGVAKVRINDLQLRAKLIYCSETPTGYKIGMQFVDVPHDKSSILRSLVDKFSRGMNLTVKAEF